MNRLILFIFVTCLSTSMLFAQASMSIDNVTAQSGTQVPVEVSVANFEDVGSLSLIITYNPSVVEYVGLENNALATQGNFLTPSASNGTLRISWFNTNPLTVQQGKIFDILFSYTSGQSDISFSSSSEVTNPLGQKINVTYNNGSVTQGTQIELDAPTLQSPSNNSTGIGLTPTLNWTDVTNATLYDVQVATDQSFTSNLIDQSSLATSTYTVASGVLANSTKYYWRARAKTDEVTGSWSTIFNFTTEVGVIVTDIVISLDNVTSPPNAEVSVPVNVTSFNDVGSLTFKINFDDTKLTFKNISNAPNGFFANAVGGLLSVAWADVSGSNPLNLGDAKLLDLNFDYTNSDVPLTFTNESELTNSTNQMLEVTFVNGSVVEGEPIPDVPVLTAPADGSTGVSLTPELSWTAAANASSYNLEVATDENFTSKIVEQTGITDTKFVIAEGSLQNNVNYYWRVSSTNSSGSSSFSNTFTFTTLLAPLTAPVLESPANESIDIGLTPSLNWSDVEEAATYSVQVSDVDDFSNLLINESGIAASEYTVQAGVLTEGNVYYWRANAADETRVSDWSLTFSFTTILPDLEAPVLSSPEDNAIDVELAPLFTWSNVEGATSFTLQVSTSSDFVSLVLDESGISLEEFSMTSDLEELTTYFWRVNATDGLRISDWSTVFTFTTLTTVLPTPVLSSPQNEAAGIMLNGTSLEWNSVEGASNYNVELATDSEFSNVVASEANTAATSYVIPDGVLNFESTYFWRVKALAEGKSSEWTEPWSFITELAPLLAPELVSPEDGATDLLLAVTFEWNAVSNASSYGLQVATENTFASPVVDETGISETTYAVAEDLLQGPVTYFWRVKSEDATRSSDWSDVWSFITEDPSSVDAFQSGIPDEFSLFQNYPNPFNPSTKIRYTLPEASQVKIVILDLLGREVSELLNTFQPAGYFEVNWNAINVSSGNYIYKIDVKSESGKIYSDMRKMQFLK